MRLGRVRISGYRKLLDTHFTTLGKLLAIVGPNEAGKSSLLDALASLGTNKPIPHSDRPRGYPVTDSEIAIEVWFRLEPEDMAAVEDLSSPVRPIWYKVVKRFGGDLDDALEPPMERDYTSRRKAEQALNRFAQTRAARELDRTEDEEGEKPPGALLDALLELVQGEDELSSGEWEELANTAVTELTQSLTSGLGARALRATAAWLVEASEKHPNEVARDRLWERRPYFSSFGDDERSLASDYDLGQVAGNPPSALANLALIAGLDLQEVARFIDTQDAGGYVSATEQANDRLAQIFREAWQQSPVVVRVHLDGHILRIMVSNQSGGYSTIAERSDGLKSFVALTAFSAQQAKGTRPMILLIDEAERHLHYDAQADLLRMLERQALALQVIYTTHSPGCLPGDLGTCVRPVVPDPGGGRSRVANSYWSGNRGFQPLLMALGAGAAAFVPSRYAVLTEGASDMLLFPSLVREATKEDRVDYQVAPGVAEASAAQLLALDMEAPRVAYLLDGDSAGVLHAQRLITSGVPPGRVVQLGGANSGVTMEDLLREDVYLRAVNETLQRVHGLENARIQSGELPALSRSKGVDDWCDRHGLARLRKPVVAAVLLEQNHNSLLTQHTRRTLIAAHTHLCRALELPTY